MKSTRRPAASSTLYRKTSKHVLQQLWDIHPDGSRGEHKVRSAGDYALTLGDGLPHLERGGEKGGMAFFGSHCTSGGALYELLDEEMKVIADVTIETLVSDWQDNT